VKDGFSKQLIDSWDALNRSFVRFDLRLHWWGDALRRVLMYSGSMEMYGVPGRSVLRKKDARVRIPSLALKSSFEATVTLAQLVERRTFNPVVVGSSPTCDKFFLLKIYIILYI
jgi:hypothetical protein